jgi:hypothetical protein
MNMVSGIADIVHWYKIGGTVSIPETDLTLFLSSGLSNMSGLMPTDNHSSACCSSRSAGIRMMCGVLLGSVLLISDIRPCRLHWVGSVVRKAQTSDRISGMKLTRREGLRSLIQRGNSMIEGWVLL